ncbi:MAG: TraI domain-containing protein [Legionellales bacterium]
MFHHQRKTASSSTVKARANRARTVTAAQLLTEDKRPGLLTKIRELSGLEDAGYQSLCVVLIENLLHYCQQLPETSTSYYSQPGGLVDFALNRTEAALSLFQDFMVQDQPGVLSNEQKLWQYALYSAALLQGIGKLFIDYKVNLFDSSGQLLKQWNPLLESLSHTGIYYDYELLTESDEAFRCRLNLLLAKALMPASGFSWIASEPQVLAVWLALLNEDLRSAGTLGALLIRSNAIAIQRYFSEFMVRHAAARGARGRAGTFTGGTPEALVDKELAVGIKFTEWLTKELDEGRMMFNKAPLRWVPSGLLISKELLQRFLLSDPEYRNWRALQVQKGFLSLGLHTRAADGSVVSHFEQDSGVVFSGYAVALPPSVTVYQADTGTTATLSAIEIIHKANNNSPFLAGSLQQLTASGQWQHANNEGSALKPGAERGG